jgi:phosphoribosyl 1,2-cyclic phosphodiesterase
MKFYILASGSKGNAVLVHDNQTTILLDFGVNKSRMMTLLKDTPFTLDDIDFVLFTHEHSDHILGKDFLPIEKRYATEKTLPLLEDHTFNHYQTRTLKGLKVTAFPVSHDAKDPVGYLVEGLSHSLVYLTDTGYVSEENIRFLKNKTYYIMESNHNVKMLLQTNRSHDLKMRILGDQGHLSNEDSAMFFSEMVGEKTKAVYLGHISEEANSPEVAVETYHKVLKKLRVNTDQLRIQATLQWAVLEGGE